MTQHDQRSNETYSLQPKVGNDETGNLDDGGVSSLSLSHVAACKTMQYQVHDEDKTRVPVQARSIPQGISADTYRESNRCDMVHHNITKEICKGVIRCKLMKRRHLIIKEGINPLYLKQIFPTVIQNFQPQHVQYNGGIANITTWKISCYLEVMDHGVPTTQPNLLLQQYCLPLLNQCNDLFLFWYQQQHNVSIQSKSESSASITKPAIRCRRLMTFITRYTPAPNEQSLLKHIDGAGKVDGSVVVALPVDEWTAPYEENAFLGGGLTFWDGPKTTVTSCPTPANANDNDTSATPRMTNEIHYDTRSGDIAFIDRAVWHQADPITKGTRWALVIFYKIEI